MMKKPLRIVRITSNKVRWEDSMEFTENQAEMIPKCCKKSKGGYLINREILSEFLVS